MVSDDVHGLLAVFPVQPDSSAGADTVGGQKCDHIPGTSIGQVRIDDLSELLFADTSDGEELLRLLIQNLKRLLAEGIIDPFSGLFTDAADLSGCQISNDSFPGGGYDFLITLHLELDTMLLTLAPLSSHIVPDFIGGRQAVAHRFELIQNVSCCILQHTTGAIDGDHEPRGACSSIPGKDDSFKCT